MTEKETVKYNMYQTSYYSYRNYKTKTSTLFNKRSFTSWKWEELLAGCKPEMFSAGKFEVAVTWLWEETGETKVKDADRVLRNQWEVQILFLLKRQPFLGWDCRCKEMKENVQSSGLSLLCNEQEETFTSGC